VRGWALLVLPRCSGGDGHDRKAHLSPRFSGVGSYRLRVEWARVQSCGPRSGPAARWARGALYGFLFIGLPGPGGVVFWFFVLTLRPDPPVQRCVPVRGTSRAHRCAGPQGARETRSPRRRRGRTATEQSGGDGARGLRGKPVGRRAAPSRDSTALAGAARSGRVLTDERSEEHLV